MPVKEARSRYHREYAQKRQPMLLRALDVAKKKPSDQIARLKEAGIVRLKEAGNYTYKTTVLLELGQGKEEPAKTKHKGLGQAQKTMGGKLVNEDLNQA